MAFLIAIYASIMLVSGVLHGDLIFACFMKSPQ